jgi:hypothetical protein
MNIEYGTVIIKLKLIHKLHKKCKIQPIHHNQHITIIKHQAKINK